MQDDLNDIDLIDKFLNQELGDLQIKQFEDRCANDAEFKKEVEVYKKIYAGIEASSEEMLLQQKLNNYYEEYLQENKQLAIIKPIGNWRKTAVIITSIAASVCLFIGIWFKNKNSMAEDPNLAKNKINKHDSLPIIDTPQQIIVKKKQIPIPLPDTGQHNMSKFLRDENSAITNQKRLPAYAIREAIYPQALAFTLNKGLLTLYGDPLIGLININIEKKNGQYFLIYNDAAYKLIETNELKPLEKIANPITDNGTASDEKMQVQIAPIQTNVLSSQQMDVVVTPGNGDKSYYFTTEKEKPLIVLGGDFDIDNCIVVKLKKDGEERWYLIYNSQVYFLDDHTHQLSPLKELSLINSAEARLFFKRSLVVKPVMLLK